MRSFDFSTEKNIKQFIKENIEECTDIQMLVEDFWDFHGIERCYTSMLITKYLVKQRIPKGAKCEKIGDEKHYIWRGDILIISPRYIMRKRVNGPIHYECRMLPNGLSYYSLYDHYELDINNFYYNATAPFSF